MTFKHISKPGSPGSSKWLSGRPHCVSSCMALLVILFASTALAQKVKVTPTDFVYASPKGIYVFCGNTSASKTHPRLDTVGYRIERKAGKERWKQIADVSSVATVEEFKRAVSEEKRMQWTTFMKLKTDDSLWLHIRAYPSLRMLPFGADREMLLPLGLLYLDSDVKQGVKYEYRVSVLLLSGKTANPKTSQPIVAGKPWGIPAMRAVGTVETDSTLLIEWACPKVYPTPHVYHVYRRMTGQEDFKLLPIKGMPSVRNDSLVCTVYDEKLKRNQQYDYYIVAEDLVENRSPESETVTAYTVNFKRLPLPMRQRAIRDSMGIRLSWMTSGWDYVLSTRIYRSSNYNGPYEKIAEVPSTDTSYYDHGARGMMRYYYRMRNVSYGERESQLSMPFMGYWKNELPPATPQGVTAKPIRNGVEIAWEKNAEEDVAGYYVCRAADKEDSLLTISALVESTNYADTSADLRGSKEYRYAIVAMNTSQKKSLFSNVVYARPSIPTNPAPPRSMYAFPRENGIALNWNDPREYEDAVIGYALYRGVRSGTTINYQRLATLMRDPEMVSYFDSTAEKGRMYHYAVASIDVYGYEGIRSKSAEAMIRIELPPAPSDVHATMQEGGVLLEWEEMPEEKIAQFVIYRNERGKDEKKIATVKYPEHQYIDRTPKDEGVYYYCIASIDSSGVEGEKSEKVYAVVR